MSGISSARALGILRNSIGILFLILAEYKVFSTQFTLVVDFSSGSTVFSKTALNPFTLPVLRNFVLPHMATLLFSSNYPGTHAPLWQYFGASLNPVVLAFCFAGFAITKTEKS